MADDVDLSEDDGWVTVKAEGGASARLDLFRVHSQIVDYHAANKSKTEEEYADGLVQFMQGLGLPACSHRLAIRFVEAIGARVDELKKKDKRHLELSASTESTPSP